MLYNHINDSEILGRSDSDIVSIRDIHGEIDRAVAEAYNWSDIPLEHGFYTYRNMRRWTISADARAEILRRLLIENHLRAAAESKQLGRNVRKMSQGEGLFEE